MTGKTQTDGTTVAIDAAAFAPTDRAEAIRNAIWELVVRVEIEQPAPQAIRAQCQLRTLGRLTQCSVKANARTIRRTPRLARDDLEPSIFLGVQTAGSSLVIQDGKEAVLRPGELALYDTSRPYTLVNQSGIAHHYFRMPKAALALPARAIDSAVATTFQLDQPLVDVASAYFNRLAGQPDLVEPTASSVSVPSIELVRALISTRTGSARLAQEPLANSVVERALTYARMHLGEQTLTPGQIAAAQHVSVRTLYAAMAAAGISLADWIRRERLEACRIELGRPGQRNLTVSAIAARWGFVDPTHFSRVFRAEFGLSPREWRRHMEPQT